MSYEEAHEHGSPLVDWSRYNLDSGEILQGSSTNNNNYYYYAASEFPSYRYFEHHDLLNWGFGPPGGGIPEAEDCALVNRSDDPQTTGHDVRNYRSSQGGGNGRNYYRLG